MIADEIQSGLGRTGKWFAYQHYGILPDITTLAKPLAGGLPLGAMLCTEAVSRAIHPGMHGTTFGGGPLACAVAIAVIDEMKSTNLLDHVTSVGDYFKQALSGLQAKHPSIVEVRGKGLMLAAQLDSAELAKAVLAQLLARKVIINRTDENVLRFLPPFILAKRTRRHDHSGHRCGSHRQAERPSTSTPNKPSPREVDSCPQTFNAGSALAPETENVASAVAESLAGRDLCSISDFTSAEVKTVLQLAHRVKQRPQDYRWALDARQMVMFFEKASLRTRVTFEAGINTLGGNAIFVDQTQSPLGERESLADMARNLERWVSLIVLRTYSHDTITEMADFATVPGD